MEKEKTCLSSFLSKHSLKWKRKHAAFSSKQKSFKIKFSILYYSVDNSQSNMKAVPGCCLVPLLDNECEPTLPVWNHSRIFYSLTLFRASVLTELKIKIKPTQGKFLCAVSYAAKFILLFF